MSCKKAVKIKQLVTVTVGAPYFVISETEHLVLTKKGTWSRMVT